MFHKIMHKSIHSIALSLSFILILFIVYNLYHPIEKTWDARKSDKVSMFKHTGHVKEDTPLSCLKYFCSSFKSNKYFILNMTITRL